MIGHSGEKMKRGQLIFILQPSNCNFFPFCYSMVSVNYNKLPLTVIYSQGYLQQPQLTALVFKICFCSSHTKISRHTHSHNCRKWPLSHLEYQQFFICCYCQMKELAGIQILTSAINSTCIELASILLSDTFWVSECVNECILITPLSK